MKGYIFAFILVSCVTNVFSQGTEMGMTPDVVLKAFIKNYSDVKVTWTEAEGTYEASFKLIGMPSTVWYDSTGQRLKYVVDIKEDQLPAIARSYIDRNYPKAKIVRSQKWTNETKANTFQADLKLPAETKSLMFTARGDLIK